MSETRFTPGPWEWLYDDADYLMGWHLSPGILIAEHGIADGTPGGDEIDRANANLIAAAPDLYAALKMALDSLETVGDEFEDGNNEAAWEYIHVARIAAKSALRRSRGEA